MSGAGAGPVETGRFVPVAPSSGRLDSRLLWPALGFAFTPTLVELGSHMLRHPAARAVWIFPVLALLLARREDATASRWGWACIVPGAVWQLMALAADAPRLARPALVLAAIGLCRITGACRWATAALLVFAIPLPHVVAERASPALERAWADLAVAVVTRVGGSIERVGEQLSAGGSGFALQAADGGLALVWLGLGLAYCADLVRNEPAGRWLAIVPKGIALGFSCQLLLLVGIAGGLVLGLPAERLRTLSDHAVWIGSSALGLALAARIARMPRSESESISTAGARAR